MLRINETFHRFFWVLFVSFLGFAWERTPFFVTSYFENGDMRHIEVIGNVLTAFYPEEKDSTMTGFNCLEGSLLHLYMKDKKMEKGLFVGKSNGTMYPMDQIPPDKLRLPTFSWFDYVRPLNKEDIFNWRGKREGEMLKPTTDRRPKTNKRNLINMK